MSGLATHRARGQTSRQGRAPIWTGSAHWRMLNALIYFILLLFVLLNNVYLSLTHQVSVSAQECRTQSD
jgi:hypothetical protein